MPGMQFPYPRKTSEGSSAFTPAFQPSRRRDLKSLAPYILGGVGFVWFVLWLLSSPATTAVAAPYGSPDLVIVTTIDPKWTTAHKQLIKDNRNEYAKKHGYGTFFPSTADYDLMKGTPESWSTIPALRHAMTMYPNTPWLWYLSSTALIMNPTQSLHERLLDPRKLESLMITDKSVVPPDSVIKTFSHLKGENIDFILSQDKEGLAGGSMFIRTGEWAKYFLDAWYDPLYRSYNFQKAEGHALEHLVQWHGTVLAKLALVPQRALNSYTSEKDGGEPNGVFKEGDLVANAHGCARNPARSCEQEVAKIQARLQAHNEQ